MCSGSSQHCFGRSVKGKSHKRLTSGYVASTEAQCWYLVQLVTTVSPCASTFMNCLGHGAALFSPLFRVIRPRHHGLQNLLSHTGLGLQLPVLCCMHVISPMALSVAVEAAVHLRHVNLFMLCLSAAHMPKASWIFIELGWLAFG